MRSFRSTYSACLLNFPTIRPMDGVALHPLGHFHRAVIALLQLGKGKLAGLFPVAAAFFLTASVVCS